jgi:hypothetical protein
VHEQEPVEVVKAEGELRFTGRSCQWEKEKAEIQMQLVGRIKIYQDRYIMIYQDHPSPN